MNIMKLNILLVEDSPVTARLVNNLFQKIEYINYNVTHADTLEKTLALLKRQKFDVILLDLGLPDSSGIDTFYRVKEAYSSAAIIVESGNDDEELAITAIQNGAQDYIRKGNFTPELLNRTVRYAVERKHIEDQLKYKVHFEQTITSISSYLKNLTHEEITDGVTRTLQHIVDFSNVDRCCFIILDDKMDIADLYESCANGVNPGFSTLDKVRLKQSLPWLFLRTESFCETMVSSLEELPPEALKERDFFKSKDIRSFGALPLIDKESLRAIICFNTVRPDHNLTEDDISLFRIVGEIIINFLGCKLLEKSREENEIMLVNILNSIHSGVLVINAQTRRVVKANQSAIEMIHSQEEDIIGTDINYFLPMDETHYKEPTGESYSKMKEAQLIVSKNRSIPVLLSVTEIMIDKDEHFVLSITDISDRKNAEYELAQDQKLKSIGSLAAGIAHEINTPAQYVSDNTRFLQDAYRDLEYLNKRFQLLLEEAEKTDQSMNLVREIKSIQADIDIEFLNEEIPTSITQSLEGLSRISRIVNAMRDYAHPELQKMKASNINKLIDNAITVGRNEWKYVAKIATDFDETVPPVTCLSGEISQVILNMVINAAHAIQERMDKGDDSMGLIRIRTKNQIDWVEIRIGDDGAGIPEDVKGRIFDPFFTTKDVGKGTGQGLALARNVVVKKHKGSISLESELEKGTEFIILLPVNGVEDSQDSEAGQENRLQPITQ